MRKVGKILRRETDDYTDFEGGVPRKAPVREDRDWYGIENHPVGRLGADWNEYYRI